MIDSRIDIWKLIRMHTSTREDVVYKHQRMQELRDILPRELQSSTLGDKSWITEVLIQIEKYFSIYEQAIQTYNRLLKLSYSLYQKDWCKRHGYMPGPVRQAFLKGKLYDGEMYRSLLDFEQHEFLSAEYLQSILPKNQFGTYLKTMNYLKIGLQDTTKREASA